MVELCADHYAQMGHEVHLAVLSGDEKLTPPVWAAGFYQLTPNQLYSLHNKDKQPIWGKVLWQLMDLHNLHSGELIRNLIRQIKPDVIQIQKMRGFSGAIWPVACHELPGRVVQTLHDFESMSPIGTLEGLVGRWAREGHVLVRPYQFVRRRQTRSVPYVTAPSRDTLDTILSHGLFASAQSQVIPNPHAWTAAQVAEHQKKNLSHPKKPGEPLIFGFLGRIEPEKGIRQLLMAFHLAHQQYPNLQLQVAGWGSLAGELHQAWGGHPGIRFLGRIDSEQKENFLREIDCLVVPSTWAEVFGIVTAEALAFGKPVIASSVGGLPEIIKEGCTGWLVPPGDVATLQLRLATLAQHPEQMAGMAVSCFQSSMRFAVDNIAGSYLQLYQRMLQD